ncbi:MAG: carbohydrate porin, partial [Woeseiaceae bacterium]
MKIILLGSAIVLLTLAGDKTYAQDLGDEIAELRQLLETTKSDYEARLAALEPRLARAEQLASSAGREAGEAIEIAEQSAIDSTAGMSAANTFNPAISAVLVGRYGNIGEGWESIPGFMPGGELGPG